MPRDGFGNLKRKGGASLLTPYVLKISKRKKSPFICPYIVADLRCMDRGEFVRGVTELRNELKRTATEVK